MIVTDPFVDRWLHPTQTAIYAVQVICTIGVVAGGKFWMRWKIARAEKAEEELAAAPVGDIVENAAVDEKVIRQG